MKRDPQTLASYLEIIDQRKRYQRHMHILQEAGPSIDTSPIPMNPSVAEKQHQNAINRVFKFQLEEDKLRFVNDLYEMKKTKKKKLQQKGRSFRRKKSNDFHLSTKILSQTESNPVSNFEDTHNDKTLDPSALIGILSQGSSVKSQRNYPKLIEPKTMKKMRKIPMSIQTANLSDQVDPFHLSSNQSNELNGIKEDANDYNQMNNDNKKTSKPDIVDIPFEYTGYLTKGDFYLSIDEKKVFCVEAINANSDDQIELNENHTILPSKEKINHHKKNFASTSSQAASVKSKTRSIK